jgi:hypothetical protein
MSKSPFCFFYFFVFFLIFPFFISLFFLYSHYPIPLTHRTRLRASDGRLQRGRDLIHARDPPSLTAPASAQEPGEKLVFPAPVAR